MSKKQKYKTKSSLLRLNNCVTYTIKISVFVLSYCLHYSSGGNGYLSHFSPLRPVRSTYHGCVSGCLHPNMSVERLLEGRHHSGNIYFDDDSQLIPQWTNHTLFKIGQKFAQENLGFLGMSHLFALIFDNFLPDVKETLLITGTTSSPEGSAKRFTATAAQVALWYQNSLDDPTQKRVLLQSLQQVRRRHFDASYKLLVKFKDPNFLEIYRKQLILKMQKDKQSIFNDYIFWSAFQADLKNSRIPLNKRVYPQFSYEGIPVNQFTHAMTLFSFAGMVVVFQRQLGILHATEEELRGYVHFWGVIGHALGVKDEYNICMQASLEETTQLFQDILDDIAIPSLFNMDETSHVQISALLDGFLIMNPMLTPGLMTYRFLRDIAQVDPVRMKKQLNIIDRFYVAGLDGLVSDNLMFNKFFTNSNGQFFLDVNGYKYFGRNYTTDEKRSQSVFYTREKVSF